MCGICLLGAANSFAQEAGGNQTSGMDDTMPTNMTIMETDGVLHTIPLDEIKYGGVPKDGIPSIDAPMFINATDAVFVDDADTVIGLNIDGDIRAYPLSILVWHEIVNDEVGGIPVAVTYCPLCYTSQVFVRVFGNESAEFGTTGNLYQSNLLMYDRLTDTYWSQALGAAVKGMLSGQQLDIIPLDLMEWGDWKRLYPETVVLDTNTGYSRAYGVDPYGSYYTDARIWFPISHTDDRMHPKEIIVGVEINGTYKAYRQAHVESEGIINDQVGGLDILVLSQYTENTRVFDRVLGNHTLTFVYNGTTITDAATGSEWDYDGVAVAGELNGAQLTRLPIWPGFWFEWATFHPHTLVYDGR